VPPSASRYQLPQPPDVQPSPQIVVAGGLHVGAHVERAQAPLLEIREAVDDVLDLRLGVT
jgi:hypothetical protein